MTYCMLRPETLVSDLRHVSELLVPGFGCDAVLSCQSKMPRERGMAASERDSYGEFRQPKFECGLRQNHYVFGLYSNPDQDDRIFVC